MKICIPQHAFKSRYAFLLLIEYLLHRTIINILDISCDYVFFCFFLGGVLLEGEAYLPICFEKITIVELNELSHWSKMLSTPELVMNLDVRRIPVI